MGPSFFNDGNDPEEFRTFRDGPRFNGAVVFQRRKRFLTQRFTPGQCGFNGAVVFQRRKLGSLQRVLLTYFRFNGAVVFQRRKPAAHIRSRTALAASMGPSFFNDGNRWPPKPFVGAVLAAGLRGVASPRQYHMGKS